MFMCLKLETYFTDIAQQYRRFQLLQPPQHPGGISRLDVLLKGTSVMNTVGIEPTTSETHVFFPNV